MSLWQNQDSTSKFQNLCFVFTLCKAGRWVWKGKGSAEDIKFHHHSHCLWVVIKCNWNHIESIFIKKTSGGGEAFLKSQRRTVVLILGSGCTPPPPQINSRKVSWVWTQQSVLFKAPQALLMGGQGWVRTADLGQWLSHLREHQNYLEGLLKHRLLGSTPRISDIVGWEWRSMTAFLTSFRRCQGTLLPQNPAFRNTGLRYFRYCYKNY